MSEVLLEEAKSPLRKPTLCSANISHFHQDVASQKLHLATELYLTSAESHWCSHFLLKFSPHTHQGPVLLPLLT